MLQYGKTKFCPALDFVQLSRNLSDHRIDFSQYLNVAVLVALVMIEPNQTKERQKASMRCWLLYHNDFPVNFKPLELLERAVDNFNSVLYWRVELLQIINRKTFMFHVFAEDSIHYLNYARQQAHYFMKLVHFLFVNFNLCWICFLICFCTN